MKTYNILFALFAAVTSGLLFLAKREGMQPNTVAYIAILAGAYLCGWATINRIRKP